MDCVTWASHRYLIKGGFEDWKLVEIERILFDSLQAGKPISETLFLHFSHERTEYSLGRML